MKHNQWRVLALGVVLVGCARTVTGVAEPPPTTQPPVTAPSVGSEVVPPPPEASAPATASAETTIATAPAETTVATTVPDYSCADFEGLLGFERMMAVKHGGAPADAACRAAVDRAALALNTYETGLVFSERFDATPIEALLQTKTCAEPALLINIFDIPVMYWGATKAIEGDDVTAYKQYVTEVLQPGDTASVEFVGSSSDDATRECNIYVEGVVAPAGGLAPGIDAAPAPADDPLGSDDVVEWAGALFTEFSPDMSVGEVVNRVEDIHSPDVGDQVRRLESGQSGDTGDPATYTVCESIPADLGPEVIGEFMWVVVAEQSSGFEGHHLGLFSRGSDRRWRFLGSTATIDETIDPNDICAVPSPLN